VAGDSFFQGNALLCEILANWAKPFVSGGLVYDLFGGVGLFSLCLGGNFTKGVLVEEVRQQTALAQTNLAQNSCGHFKVVTDSVENFLSRKPDKPDCIIVDPPRAGLSPRARSGIARLHPKTLLYVSCDGATLARDLGFFIKESGYAVTQAALFDLYPQTSHCESAVILAAL
jgi:23S rRNA (uracil1939-C5)-methyltransferase